MKDRLYIFSDTLIKRKDNTILLEGLLPFEESELSEELELVKEEYLGGADVSIPSGTKKIVPIESIDSIFAMGTVQFNSRLLYLLSKNSIPVHIFTLKGGYTGSFLPTEKPIAGSLLIKMANYYSDYKKRLFVAKQFVNGAAKNSLNNLKYYKSRGSKTDDHVEYIEDMIKTINEAKDIKELMGIEGIIKRTYYDAWKYIFKVPTGFSERRKNPPPDLINSLISYGNMIVYSVCLNEIYKTRLSPEISYLHETIDARINLSLDIAEIFKPIITDQTIFTVINKNIIGDKNCKIKNNRCSLDKESRIKYAQLIEEKLSTKIQIPEKTVKLSYARIIREECYKLIKHFEEEEIYKPYIQKAH